MRLNDFPDCRLAHALIDKCQQRKDLTFDFQGQFNTLRERVSQETRYINALFPEYTPHDDQYHLSRLFFVADTILGDSIIDSLNSVELFTFSCGLYAHDWGMAVSNAEKNAIIGLLGTASTAEFALLPNEHVLIRDYCRSSRVSIEEVAKHGIPDGLWREYVRNTHAARSAQRVRQHFLNVDGGIAEAVARICEGHWLDLERLNDFAEYPYDFAVLRENVNVRALAIYTRIVDLFDLGEDRTPYVIWKYVAPRDPQSQMEWKKHRALRPVTTPPYLDGRIVLVDGGTDDHEVYAALEDLRTYCDEQLKGCSDLLSQQPSRYQWNLYRLEWRVAARGFTPIAIRFDFDRVRVLQILGEEIYAGDKYVFLRELLQNSIDAIRLRRAQLERNGLAPGAIGTIRVRVVIDDEGREVVEWTDDGVGMNEYIVRNYLSVAGRSYYTSDDFQRESLRMDAISRFGVGILSCFTVAQRVEIETRREPYWGGDVTPLLISIPSVDRQFRIRPLGQNEIAVGTKVRVFLSEPRRLTLGATSITNYVAKVAALCEFPIAIEEDASRALILSSLPASDMRSRFSEHEILQPTPHYPTQLAILPQDQAIAAELLEQRAFDLTIDLGLIGYRGFMCYLRPKANVVDLKMMRFAGMESGAIATVQATEGQFVEHTIRFTEAFGDHYILREDERSAVPRSIRSEAWFSVYRDGILLAEAQAPSEISDQYHWSPTGKPYIVANVPRGDRDKIDLARTTVRDGGHWFAPIRDAHERVIKAELHDQLQNKSTADQLRAIVRRLVDDKIDSDRLEHILSRENWPIANVVESNGLGVALLGDLAVGDVYIMPSFSVVLAKSVVKDFIQGRPVSGSFLSRWSGPRVVLTENTYSSLDSAYVRALTQLGHTALRKSHFLADISLVNPALETGHPDVMERWIPKTGVGRSIDQIAAAFLSESSEITLEELAIYSQRERHTSRYACYTHLTGNTPSVCLVASEQRFGPYVNIDHPVGLIIARVDAWLYGHGQTEHTNSVLRGRVQDALNDLSRARYFGVRYESLLLRLCAVASEIGIIDAKRLASIRSKDCVTVVTNHSSEAYHVPTPQFETTSEVFGLPWALASKEGRKIRRKRVRRA
jgi:hypothetical protein